jgi:hypothetical protein
VPVISDSGNSSRSASRDLGNSSHGTCSSECLQCEILKKFLTSAAFNVGTKTQLFHQCQKNWHSQFLQINHADLGGNVDLVIQFISATYLSCCVNGTIYLNVSNHSNAERWLEVQNRHVSIIQSCNSVLFRFHHAASQLDLYPVTEFTSCTRRPFYGESVSGSPVCSSAVRPNNFKAQEDTGSTSNRQKTANAVSVCQPVRTWFY